MDNNNNNYIISFRSLPWSSMEVHIKVADMQGTSRGFEGWVPFTVHSHDHTHWQRYTTHWEVTTAMVFDVGPANERNICD